MRLLLIRHGQTPANVLGLLDSAPPGPGLTELGEQQAALVPDALHEEPVDAIFGSILVRTQHTAEPLALDRRLDVDVLPGLHEIQSGELEKRSDPASVRRYLETAFAWGAGDLDARMPGSENGHDFFGRYDADIATIEASGVGTAVVFSHGAAIRVWAAGRAANLPPMFAAENSLHNTGIVALDGSMDSGWTLLSWAGTPIGGAMVEDVAAEDPTGETLREARSA